MMLHQALQACFLMSESDDERSGALLGWYSKQQTCMSRQIGSGNDRPSERYAKECLSAIRDRALQALCAGVKDTEVRDYKN